MDLIGYAQPIVGDGVAPNSDAPRARVDVNSRLLHSIGCGVRDEIARQYPIAAHVSGAALRTKDDAGQALIVDDDVVDERSGFLALDADARSSTYAVALYQIVGDVEAPPWLSGIAGSGVRTDGKPVAIVDEGVVLHGMVTRPE